MQELSLFDNKFSINATSSYDISVQFSLSGYAYAIFDTTTQKYVAIKCQPINWTTAQAFQKNLEGALTKDAFIGKKYNRIFLSFEGRKSTLVPNSFFEPEKLKSYIEFNFSNSETAEVHNLAIKEIDTKLIYAVPSEVTHPVTQKIAPGLTFEHFAKYFISSNIKLPYTVSVSVSLHENYFYLTVANSGKLLIFNSYSFRDDNDLVYYIMYTLKQLGIQQNEAVITLSGIIDSDSEACKLMQRFMSNIRFAEVNPNFFKSKIFDKLELHKYYNLLSIRECALLEEQ